MWKQLMKRGKGETEFGSSPTSPKTKNTYAAIAVV